MMNMTVLSLLPDCVKPSEVVDYRHECVTWDGRPPIFERNSIIYLRGKWWTLGVRRKVVVRIPNASPRLHNALRDIVDGWVYTNTRNRFN